MKLHHRVTIKGAKRFGRWLYFWSCPECCMTSFGDRLHAEVYRTGEMHAHNCDRLYALNRQHADPCHTCGCSGRIVDECPVCLGRGHL